MAMDINDFGLEQEAFGFGGSYQQMSRSNTNFLNFGSSESRKANRIKEDYFKRIDALPPTDQEGRNALFAELEVKLKEINAPNADITNVQSAKNKSQRGEKLVSGLQSALNIFNKTTDTLGMGKSVQGEQGGGGGGNSGGGSTTGSQVPTWVWIAGGAVVLGLGIFAIYKFRQ
jgi:hypothetical protein